MTNYLKGVRPLDYVLAGVFTAGGIFLMVQNTTTTEKLPHPLSTTTWAIVPVFVLVTLPILWRRSNALAAVIATALATVLHVALFGWLTRCGVELPLSFALAYAIGRFGGSRKNQGIGLAVLVALQVIMAARDSSMGGMVGALSVLLPGAALLYGAGLFVHSRTAKKPVTELTVAAEPIAV